MSCCDVLELFGVMCRFSGGFLVAFQGWPIGLGMIFYVLAKLRYMHIPHWS